MQVKLRTIFDHEHHCYFSWCKNPAAYCFRLKEPQKGSGGMHITYSMCLEHSVHARQDPLCECIGTPDECDVAEIMNE